MISNEERLYNKLINIYPNFMKPISELSYNSTDKRNFIQSKYLAFDFDNVINCHLNCDGGLHSSPDALFLKSNRLYFIEFKEGKCDTANIRMKIHEAVATLYSFCIRHIPEISRDDFFKLDIRYAVMMRQGNPKTFLTTLKATEERFKLKNLEGYIVKQTKVISCPKIIVKTLISITDETVKPLIIHNREHDSYSQMI